MQSLKCVTHYIFAAEHFQILKNQNYILFIAFIYVFKCELMNFDNKQRGRQCFFHAS